MEKLNIHVGVKFPLNAMEELVSKLRSQLWPRCQDNITPTIQIPNCKFGLIEAIKIKNGA